MRTLLGASLPMLLLLAGCSAGTFITIENSDFKDVNPHFLTAPEDVLSRYRVGAAIVVPSFQSSVAGQVGSYKLALSVVAPQDVVSVRVDSVQFLVDGQPTSHVAGLEARNLLDTEARLLQSGQLSRKVVGIPLAGFGRILKRQKFAKLRSDQIFGGGYSEPRQDTERLSLQTVIQVSTVDASGNQSAAEISSSYELRQLRLAAIWRQRV